MIKVAISVLPLHSGHLHRGVGFYTKNLLAELKRQPQIEITEFINVSEIKNADVIHYPFFDLFKVSLPIFRPSSVVVTIHDVVPLRFPQHYPMGVKGRINLWRQTMALKKVAAVITDSNSSKLDIGKYLHINPNIIYPIYLAPAKHFQLINDSSRLKLIKNKYNLPDQFVLFVGDINWNKNLPNMVKSCIKTGIDLVLVGKNFENHVDLNHPELKSFKEFIDQYSQNSLIHILGFVPDEDLAALYNLAKGLLLPSFYEGFGLPILEAQACRCPIVTSNVSSMPEVAGKGALLVDPENIDEISQAILKIVTDQSTRNKLIKLGLENVKNFSWGKTAAETISVYGQVIRHAI